LFEFAQDDFGEEEGDGEGQPVGEGVDVLGAFLHF